MTPKNKNQNKSISAFTLIEMVIVLVIIGILLMATLYFSGEQIQKVRDKTVKESILAEMQSRYSRNLGSSSFAGIMYNTMDVTFSGGKNEINFKYNPKSGKEEDVKENTFKDNFKIKYITTNYNNSTSDPGKEKVDDIKLIYSPYQIPCKIGDKDENKNVVIVVNVNNSRDYCFEIQKKNCRLMEIPEEKCKNLKDKAHLD